MTEETRKDDNCDYEFDVEIQDREEEEDFRFREANRVKLAAIIRRQQLEDLAVDAYHDEHFPFESTPFGVKPWKTSDFTKWFVANFNKLELWRMCNPDDMWHIS